VIPAAFITEWRARVPWPESYQVEQDLILSRLMVEIAGSELLGGELVMRGGTCLHKLHLLKPYRYSEDLDYVRRTAGPIGTYLDQLRAVAEDVGLSVSHVDRAGQMVHVILEAQATDPHGQIRIKIETNITETTPFQTPTTIEHAIASRWWNGDAKIPTFVLDEMMSTKLRALYQRRKGRDLFDIWLVLTGGEAAPAEIVGGLEHYMRNNVFTYPQLRLNLLGKLTDASFRTDLASLVAEIPEGYNIDIAADTLMERIGVLLRNAPPLERIVDGGWRERPSDKMSTE
jgi:predicted nucleotidyltransferase component of viral defense system